MIAAGCSQTPGKRANRKSGVLVRNLSGNPTNQELTATLYGPLKVLSCC
jgi:hypothetical protein